MFGTTYLIFSVIGTTSKVTKSLGYRWVGNVQEAAATLLPWSHVATEHTCSYSALRLTVLLWSDHSRHVNTMFEQGLCASKCTVPAFRYLTIRLVPHYVNKQNIQHFSLMPDIPFFYSYLCSLVLLSPSLSLSQHVSAMATLPSAGSVWRCSSSLGGSVEECVWSAGTTQEDATASSVRMDTHATTASPSVTARPANVSLCVCLIMCAVNVL